MNFNEIRIKTELQVGKQKIINGYIIVRNN